MGNSGGIEKIDRWVFLFPPRIPPFPLVQVKCCASMRLPLIHQIMAREISKKRRRPVVFVECPDFVLGGRCRSVVKKFKNKKFNEMNLFGDLGIFSSVLLSSALLSSQDSRRRKTGWFYLYLRVHLHEILEEPAGGYNQKDAVESGVDKRRIGFLIFSLSRLIFLLLLLWVFGARLAYRCGTRAGLVAPCNKSRLHHPSSSSDSHKVSFLLPFFELSQRYPHTEKVTGWGRLSVLSASSFFFDSP